MYQSIQEAVDAKPKNIQLERAGINRYEKVLVFANTRPWLDEDCREELESED